MDTQDAFVYVVDDDPSVCASVARLISSVGWRTQTFGSAQTFLASPRPQGPSCLVLDVNLPGLSGLDLQQELLKANIQIPIIFVTGNGDIPMSVRAIKAGALEFLTKPVREGELLDAIRAAIDGCQAGDLSLTARERSVLQLIGQGLTNKRIARDLDIAPETVKSHAKHIFVKLGTQTRAQSVAQAVRLGLV